MAKRRAGTSSARNSASDPYQIELSGSARRDIGKLSKSVQAELPTHIAVLTRTPRAGQALRGTLRGLRSYHFACGGVQYRIVYEILDDRRIVLIAMVGPRENFYQRLRRRVRKS